jgi:hypothetical protein
MPNPDPKKRKINNFGSSTLAKWIDFFHIQAVKKNCLFRQKGPDRIRIRISTLLVSITLSVNYAIITDINVGRYLRDTSCWREAEARPTLVSGTDSRFSKSRPTASSVSGPALLG